MNTRAEPTHSMQESRPEQTTSKVRQATLDVLELTKPKVQILLLLTTVAAMYAAGDPSPELALWTMLGGALSAGGAGAINHWYDRDIDQLMSRTADRPIPSGRMGEKTALIIGLLLSAASVAVFWIFTNPVATAFSVAGLLWYTLIYTAWLKRRTVQNIVIGGAAGAFPPMVGWAAATGEFRLVSILPFLIIFAWTAPHFWALSLLIKDQYAAAKVPMLPVVKGETETHRQIIIWAWITLIVTLLPLGLRLTGVLKGEDAAPFGWIYGFFAVVLSFGLVQRSYSLRKKADHKAALALHLYALAFLALLFSAMVASYQLAF